jgi:Fe2+ transport system protein FeoA
MSESSVGSSYPLTLAGEKIVVCITEIRGGRSFREKCFNQGIIPGREIEVIANSSGGPCLIAVLNTRLMIGRGMSSRILVR